ncbi:MAG: nicotinic acid mononucleotide adenylyltransferase [Bacteroidetes bacterium CG2_30_33_31]|nr:MAG: nicotinic acid mononucleotide adenylyltransferase [Bacteroidetes bacterium CG2_30_33_31]
MEGKKKIGLFFGSFNPIHIGHLIIANFFVENSNLNEVWFIISPQNPFKNKESLLDDRQRFYMVQLAVEDNSKFKASNIEFHLEKPSYTIFTLAVLAEKYPNFDFVLLVGSDNLENFGKWKNYEDILSNHQIFVYRRPGSKNSEFDEHANVKFFDAPLMQISSSYIRKQIKAKRSVEYLLPPKVFDYISEMHLYI